MPGPRYLIVNADDFGQDPEINRGVAQAHERGIVTSASLMVRWPAAEEGARYARSSRLDLGLHLDLGEWRFARGAWEPVYQVASLDDAEAIQTEVRSQVGRFRDLVGEDPTHLDSHQHVHLRKPVRALLAAVAEEIGVPLRGVTTELRYCGEFYGQTREGIARPRAISARALQDLVLGLREGVTELACHPGGEVGLDTMYRDERAREVEALCDPEVRAAIREAHVELCSFQDRFWERTASTRGMP